MFPTPGVSGGQQGLELPVQHPRDTEPQPCSVKQHTILLSLWLEAFMRTCSFCLYSSKRKKDAYNLVLEKLAENQSSVPAPFALPENAAEMPGSIS